MPDRYTLFETGELRDRFVLPHGVPAGIKKSYNMSPGQKVPVIILKNGERVMERMIWGFIPPNAKDTNSIFRYKTHHAKSKDVFSKPTWQGAIRSKRCLIPANGFYEWRKAPEGKHAFYIRSVDQSLLGFAGIYSEWTDPEGVAHGICAIITIDSGTRSEQLPSRLPVAISPQDEVRWLDSDVSDVSTIYSVMYPFEAEQLVVTRVGDAINSLKPNSPDLIAPLKHSA